LGHCDTSPAQFARSRGEPVSNVTYHFRRLQELGCIELVDTRPVKGTVEHVYRRVTHPFDEAGWFAALGGVPPFPSLTGRTNTSNVAAMRDFESASEVAERFLCNAGAEAFDLHGTLMDLADFMVEDPPRARALFIDAHLAGGPLAGTRTAILKRLGQALDAALRDKGRPEPPAIAGEFMVSAIDHVAASALIRGEPEDFRRRVPALVALVHSAYGLPAEGS
jgi:hypothetical protein